VRGQEIGELGRVALFGNDKKTETNTLTLIRRWSMAGARSDFEAHFTSPVDIHAAVAERREESADELPPPATPTVLMKPAGEDDWRPLLVGVPTE
jgi:hypothetical protein